MLTLGGVATCALGLAAVAVLLLAARRSGLLAPVLGALLLRSVLVVATHLASVHAGDGGFMFLDDHGLLREADSLARGWGSGSLFSPRSATGSYQAGYQASLAAIFLLSGSHLLVAKFFNVLLGTVTVLLSGLLAGRLLGAPSARRATWIVALLPTTVFWSITAVKEPLVAALVVACLLLFTQMTSLKTLAAVVLGLAALVSVRGLSGVAITGAAALALIWTVIRHRDELSERALLRGGGLLLLGGLAALTAVSGGHPVQLVDTYIAAAGNMFARYQQSAASIPPDVFRAFISPRPWVFDSHGAQGWYRALYPGMWVLYALYPLAVLGVWRGRRRPEILLLVAACVIFMLTHAVLSGSGVRQRSGIEPLVVILAVGAAPSLREALRLPALGLAVAGLGAVIDGSTPAVGPVLLALAGLAWLIVGRLPERRDSPAGWPEPLRGVVVGWAGRTAGRATTVDLLATWRRGRGAKPALHIVSAPLPLMRLATAAGRPPQPPVGAPPTPAWPDRAIETLVGQPLPPLAPLSRPLAPPPRGAIRGAHRTALGAWRLSRKAAPTPVGSSAPPELARLVTAFRHQLRLPIGIPEVTGRPVRAAGRGGAKPPLSPPAPSHPRPLLPSARAFARHLRTLMARRPGAASVPPLQAPSAPARAGRLASVSRHLPRPPLARPPSPTWPSSARRRTEPPLGEPPAPPEWLSGDTADGVRGAVLDLPPARGPRFQRAIARLRKAGSRGGDLEP